MLKKSIKILFASLFIASALTITAYAQDGAVSANYVNMRSGPGMNYEVIDCLVRGTVVTITDTTDSSWYKISFNGQDGYMSKDYVSLIEGITISAYPTPEPSGQIDFSSLESNTSTSESNLASDSVVPESETEAEVVEATQAPVLTPTPTPTPIITVEDASGSGTIGGDYVRFRTGPDTTYSIISTYNRGQPLTILGTVSGWTKCTINNQEGYVYSQYVITDSAVSVSSESENISTKTEAVESQSSSEPQLSVNTESDGYICGNNVRFRSGPSLTASIIGEFYFANPIKITGTSGDWTAVTYNSKNGYVYSQYVKSGSFNDVVTSSTESTESSAEASNSVSGQDIVNYAMQYLGYNYKWGGTSPDTGFDCSGFVWYVYNHFGYVLNRVAADQAQNGKAVSADTLQPGDILCFYSNGSIGHSGIYIGDGKFIHSATTNTGVIVTELSGSYWSRGFEARRIIT